jgi:GNAT superfamily N-acetyltransferase
MEPVSFTVMPATLLDIDVIVSHRRSMIAAMGYSDDAALDAMSSAFEPWLRRTMLAGEYLAWLAITRDHITQDRAVAAGLGLWLMDWPPHMIGSGARRGNILNIFVRPENRRQGIARELMRTALDCAAPMPSAMSCCIPAWMGGVYMNRSASRPPTRCVCCRVTRRKARRRLC